VVEKINISETRQDRGFDVEWNRRTGNKLELGRQFGRVSGSLFYVSEIGQSCWGKCKMYLRGYGTPLQRISPPKSLGR